jgi:hypothetical protein
MRRRLVDSAAAAVELGVSVRTVRRLVKDRTLVNHGKRGQIMVDLDELERIEEQAGDCRQPRRTLRRLRALGTGVAATPA